MDFAIGCSRIDVGLQDYHFLPAAGDFHGSSARPKELPQANGLLGNIAEMQGALDLVKVLPHEIQGLCTRPQPHRIQQGAVGMAAAARGRNVLRRLSLIHI